MMESLPESWKVEQLDKVVTIEMGQSPPSSSYNEEGNGLPFFQGKGEFGDWYPTIRKYTTSPMKIVDRDAVLLSVRAPVGPTNLAPEKCCIGRGLAGIYSDEIPNKYLLYFFRCIENELSQQGTGTTFSAINKSLIQKVEIPLAPLPEQKRIVAKLDNLFAHLDQLKARLQNIPTLLKQFRQAVLTQAVTGKLTEEWRGKNKTRPFKKILIESFKKEIVKGRKAENSQINNWCHTNIGSIINVKSGDGLSANVRNEGEIPVYGGNGVTGFHDEPNVKTETIVIGRVGFYCGSVHYTENQAWVTDNAFIVSFDDAIFDKRFLYWLLKATDLRVNTSSTAQPVISGGKIYPIEIEVPEIKEQKEIVRRVESLFAFADKIEAHYNTLEEKTDHLPQTILAKAFRGELVEQDPSDGSAEELLKVIKHVHEDSNDRPQKKPRKAKRETTSKTQTGVANIITPLTKRLHVKDVPLTSILQELFGTKVFKNDNLRDIRMDYNSIKNQLFEILDVSGKLKNGLRLVMTYGKDGVRFKLFER